MIARRIFIKKLELVRGSRKILSQGLAKLNKIAESLNDLKTLLRMLDLYRIEILSADMLFLGDIDLPAELINLLVSLKMLL